MSATTRDDPFAPPTRAEAEAFAARLHADIAEIRSRRASAERELSEHVARVAEIREALEKIDRELVRYGRLGREVDDGE